MRKAVLDIQNPLAERPDPDPGRGSPAPASLPPPFRLNVTRACSF